MEPIQLKPKRKLKPAVKKGILNNNLDVLLKKTGISIYEFARQTGINRNDMYGYKNDIYYPSLPQAFKIAHILGTTVDKIWSVK